MTCDGPQFPTDNYPRSGSEIHGFGSDIAPTTPIRFEDRNRNCMSNHGFQNHTRCGCPIDCRWGQAPLVGGREVGCAECIAHPNSVRGLSNSRAQPLAGRHEIPVVRVASLLQNGSHLWSGRRQTYPPASVASIDEEIATTGFGEQSNSRRDSGNFSEDGRELKDPAILAGLSAVDDREHQPTRSDATVMDGRVGDDHVLECLGGDDPAGVGVAVVVREVAA